MLIPAGQIISKTLTLYRDHWKMILKYLLLLLVPSIFAIALSMVLSFLLVVVGATTQNLSAALLPVGVYGLLLIIIAFVGFWFTIALIRMLGGAYEGRTARPMKEELRDAVRHIWPGFLASLLASLAILAGFILFIIPAFLFAIWFGFSLFAVIFEDKKPIEALKASKGLVSGRWWGTFWRLLAPAFVFTVLLFIVQWIVGLPFETTLAQTNQTSFSGMGMALLYAAIMSVVNLIFTPLTTIATTILYIELKKTPKA